MYSRLGCTPPVNATNATRSTCCRAAHESIAVLCAPCSGRADLRFTPLIEQAACGEYQSKRCAAAFTHRPPLTRAKRESESMIVIKAKTRFEAEPTGDEDDKGRTRVGDKGRRSGAAAAHRRRYRVSVLPLW